MIPSFSYELLDLGILYGTLGGPEFSTLVTPLDSGYDGRFARTPRGRWQLGQASFLSSEWDYLLDFFWRHRGAGIGFWWKDWTDYKVTDGLIGIGDGTTTRFPLTKTYPNGYQKRIFRALSDTFEVTVEDSEINYLLNADGCDVVFQTAPDTGLEIRASFEFYKPVRFEQDQINSRFDAFDPSTKEAIYFVDNLPIVELTEVPRQYSLVGDLPLEYAITTFAPNSDSIPINLEISGFFAAGFEEANPYTIFRQGPIGSINWFFAEYSFVSNPDKPRLYPPFTIPSGLQLFYEFTANGNYEVFRKYWLGCTSVSVVVGSPNIEFTLSPVWPS